MKRYIRRVTEVNDPRYQSYAYHVVDRNYDVAGTFDDYDEAVDFAIANDCVRIDKSMDKDPKYQMNSRKRYTVWENDR